MVAGSSLTCSGFFRKAVDAGAPGFCLIAFDRSDHHFDAGVHRSPLSGLIKPITGLFSTKRNLLVLQANIEQAGDCRGHLIDVLRLAHEGIHAGAPCFRFILFS